MSNAPLLSIPSFLCTHHAAAAARRFTSAITTTACVRSRGLRDDASNDTRGRRVRALAAGSPVDWKGTVARATLRASVSRKRLDERKKRRRQGNQRPAHVRFLYVNTNVF